jgi:hypothetical protein
MNNSLDYSCGVDSQNRGCLAEKKMNPVNWSGGYIYFREIWNEELLGIAHFIFDSLCLP